MKISMVTLIPHHKQKYNMLHKTQNVVNNYIVRTYRDVIVVTNIVTIRTSRA